MSLSSDLISQFVKATKDNDTTKRDTTVYGTTKNHDGVMYVQLDGSDILTPIATTSTVREGERVLVMIKNHTATIIGSTTEPSASSRTVSEVSERVNSATSDASAAKKVATNYIDFKEDVGMIVGDMTEDVLGKNVKIDSDSVDICDGDTVLASFGAQHVDLGKNSQDSIINMCGGLGSISSDEGALRISAPNGPMSIQSYAEGVSNALYLGVFDRQPLWFLSMDNDGYVMNLTGHSGSGLNLQTDYHMVIKAKKSLTLGANGYDYNPYYTVGDEFVVYWDGAGFITSSSKNVYFTIPIAKPIIGSPTVTVTSTDGLRVRQNDKYLYGSASNGWAVPASYTADYTNTDGNFIRVTAVMPNTTNVTTNNETCGISAHIKITFS